MKKYARQIGTRVKSDILVARDNLTDSARDKVDEALSSRDELRKIYDHVNVLRRIIKDGQIENYEEYRKWCRTTPVDRKGVLSDTTIYIEEYENEILNFYRRRVPMTQDVFIKIKALVDKLASVKRWSDKAPELMRARILYSGIVDEYEDLESRQWYGVSYEEVMKNIEKLIDEGGTF